MNRKIKEEVLLRVKSENSFQNLLQNSVNEDLDSGNEYFESMLGDHQHINDTLELYREFYSGKLIKVFREIAKYSEFTLDYLLTQQKHDDELLILMMIQGPLLDDMVLTTITAALASSKNMFKYYAAQDLAETLDRCNLYSQAHVNKALSRLKQLMKLGILFTPKTVIATFQYYKKKSVNCDAPISTLTDEDIRNTPVFKRLITNILKIIKNKLHACIGHCLEKSVYKEKVLIKEICISKTLLIGLVCGLMKRDAVLSTSTLFLASQLTNLPDLIEWIKKTQPLAAEDLQAAGKFLTALKESHLFVVPSSTEELLLGLFTAFNCCVCELTCKQSFCQPNQNTNLFTPQTSNDDIGSNPNPNENILDAIISAMNEAAQLDQNSSNAVQRPKMTKELFAMFQKKMKKLRKKFRKQQRQDQLKRLNRIG